MFDTDVIADYFIILASDKKHNPYNIALSSKRLQLFLYYAYVWYLVLYKRKLFDEPLEVWESRIIVQSQYRRFKHRSSWRALTANSIKLPDFSKLSRKKTRFLLAIFRAYNQYSNIQLFNRIKKEGAYSAALRGMKIINDYDIKHYYSDFVSVLPESTVIRQGDYGYELFRPDQETLDAIENHERDCSIYLLPEKRT